MISYTPLWKTMEDRGITTYTLITRHNFSHQTIYNLRHNKSITLYTLEKLCKILNTTADGIVVFLPDAADETQDPLI